MSAPGRTGGSPARTIGHVDMDAFFVACEVRRDPSLAGKPVVVGGTGERGVVAAASYEARRYGVHSAMPSVRAQRLCPEAIFVRGDHDHYAHVSAQVRAILDRFTPVIEPISLDEAFLELTGSLRRFGEARAIGDGIRAQVADELGLSCSVGVASAKMLAKLASEAAKPKARPSGIEPGRGVVVVPAGEELAFLHRHPVQALWGVGPATLERLRRLGVSTVGDLAVVGEDTLVRTLGRAHGRHLHALANGRDDRAVEPDRATKSIGYEETFAHDRYTHEDVHVELVRQCDAVAGRLRTAGLAGRTVTIKVRFADFRTITRSHTAAEGIDAGTELLRVASQLLAGLDVSPGVRLFGVSASNLGPPMRQLTLDEVVPEGSPPARAWDDANRVVDAIRERFGGSAIAPAGLVRPGGGVEVSRRGAQQWGPNAPEG